MEIKLNCGCGQKYKFDVEPHAGRMPVKVACPVCGIDGTEAADEYLAQTYAATPSPAPVRILQVSPSRANSAGTATLPMQPAVAPARRQTRSFYGQLPGAFAYPLMGAGMIILICATISYSAVYFVTGGLFGLLFRIMLYGFVFLFMQNIIMTTTSDEKESLSFPDASGLFGAAFQLAGTIAASFWPALVLEIAKLNGVDIPSEAIIACVILGGIYFPMALLAVAMKDTVLAANPLVVIPAMTKAPLKYSITAALTLVVFGVRQLGSLISGGARNVSLRTHDINVFYWTVVIQVVGAFLSVYLLTVTMRLLGLFYNATKKQLGWYNF